MSGKHKQSRARRAWEGRTAAARTAIHTATSYGKTIVDRLSRYDIYDKAAAAKLRNDATVMRAMSLISRWFSSGQTVYSIDQDLLDELMQSELPSTAVPVDVLRHLPHEAALLALPTPIEYERLDGSSDMFVGFIVTVLPSMVPKPGHLPDDDLFTESDVLAVVWFGHSKDNPNEVVVVTQSVFLTGKMTFRDSLDLIMGRKVLDLDGNVQDPSPRTSAEMQEYLDQRGVEWDDTAERLFPTAMNLMLYVASERPDLAPLAPPNGVRPVRGVGGSTVKMYDLGWRIGSALRAVRSHSEGRREHQGGTVVPHIRRGHYHSFWTGPRDGERRLLVKWLPPIPVNADKGDIAPTIRPIK